MADRSDRKPHALSHADLVLYTGGIAMQPPILETVEPVVATARHVRVDLQEVEKVAAWMAYEELPYPDFFSPLNPDSDIDTLDFICLYNSINFAFTDFDTHKMFRIRYAGAER